MRTRPRRARGFTIIEVMLVVVIIGIISSLSIPYYLKTTARAYRSEMMVVQNKVRQYFIGIYNDQTSYVVANGISSGHSSAWNPAGAPGPSGNWSKTANGWLDMPFPPEGNVKMRYRYSVDSPTQMTFYVCGVFPGFGPAIYNCGADEGGTGAISGNYFYYETMISNTVDPATQFEFPQPGF